MLKAIIFDMDGVLIDSNNAWYIIFDKTLQHFENRTISRKDFDKKVWAKNFNETTKLYFSVGVDKIKEHYGMLHDVFMENLRLFPDTKSALKLLKSKKIRLAVATNTHYQHAVQVLKETGLLDFFDYIIGGDMVKNGKPEPDLLLKTMSDNKWNKDEAIFVGDTIWDKIAAEKAGVKFIGFGIDGDERIENLNDIIKII